MFTVVFFGHRRVEDIPSVERMLDAYLDFVLAKEGWVECLVGKNGMFDQLVSSAVKRGEKKRLRPRSFDTGIAVRNCRTSR